MVAGKAQKQIQMDGMHSTVQTQSMRAKVRLAMLRVSF